MAQRDVRHNVKVAQSLTPAARIASANGTGVDTLGFEGVMFLIETGTVTDGTHTLTFEESNDNVSFSAIAAAELSSEEATVAADGNVVLTTAAADDNAIFKVNYMGDARYVRIVTTVAGASTGGVYHGAVLMTHGRHMPVE